MDHSLRAYLSRRTNQELEQIILLYRQQEENEFNDYVIAQAEEILKSRQPKE